jgi:hypothetical protein
MMAARVNQRRQSSSTLPVATATATSCTGGRQFPTIRAARRRSTEGATRTHPRTNDPLPVVALRPALHVLLATLVVIAGCSDKGDAKQEVKGRDSYATRRASFLRMTPDGIIHTVKDATGYPLAAPPNDFGFDREHRALLVRDTSKPDQGVASVTLDGKVSPIPATTGQIGKDDAFWATSDGVVYAWEIKSGKVRYLGPSA